MNDIKRNGARQSARFGKARLGGTQRLRPLALAGRQHDDGGRTKTDASALIEPLP